MAIQVISPGWQPRSATREKAARADEPQGLRDDFLVPELKIRDETVLEARPSTRGQGGTASEILDFTADVSPGHVAVLAIRHPSGALTFHVPVQATTRGATGPAKARFQVTVRSSGETRS